MWEATLSCVYIALASLSLLALPAQSIDAVNSISNFFFPGRMDQQLQFGGAESRPSDRVLLALIAFTAAPVSYYYYCMRENREFALATAKGRIVLFFSVLMYVLAGLAPYIVTCFFLLDLVLAVSTLASVQAAAARPTRGRGRIPKDNDTR